MSLHLRASAVLTAAALAAGLATAGPATAAQTGAQAQLSIGACAVKQSRNAGGYAWAACTVTSEAPAGARTGVRFTINQTTFDPGTPGPWRKRSGTLAFSGGGEQVLTLKFAVKGKTVAQLRRSLKVTLTGATGATIADGTAVAATS